MGIIDFDITNCVDSFVLKKYLLKDQLLLIVYSATADNLNVYHRHPDLVYLILSFVEVSFIINFEEFIEGWILEEMDIDEAVVDLSIR